MEQYREIRSGQMITPRSEYLRKLYERQPLRYEKITLDQNQKQEQETAKTKIAKSRAKPETGKQSND